MGDAVNNGAINWNKDFIYVYENVIMKPIIESGNMSQGLRALDDYIEDLVGFPEPT